MEHQKTAIEPAGHADPSFLVRHEFDDVDELAKIARSWDLDLRQLSPGGFEGRVVQAGAEILQLSRTLRRGFGERFGISPKAYLQAQRLIGVRRQLRAAAPGDLISDVANAWGYWHMGQFAADYRRQFGELPSETVRR